MQLKISPIKKSLVISLVVFVLFSTSFFYFNTRKNLDINSRSAVDSGLPLHLKIPKINVDSAIENVGLTSDGAMNTPKILMDVAWFELGVRPGEIGSAVIAGHYGWKSSKASAFDNLYKLQKGDKLYIENDKGVIISFTVQEIKEYNPKDDAVDIFSSKDNKSHLNLITCDGVWNQFEKSYSKRLVIFSDRDLK